MDVDRSRFLVLTASIAAARGARPAPAGPVEGAAPAPTLPVERPADDDEDPPAAPPPSGPRQAAVPEAPGAAQAATVGDIAPEAGPCDSAAGKPGDCAALRAPGPQCESFSDTRRMCGVWRKGFQPRVAEKAVGCLLAMSGTRDVCDPSRIEACALQALRSACADTSAEARCDAIVAGCAGLRYATVTRSACVAALSAVVPWSRPRLASCMTEGCSVDGCFYDL